MLDSLSSNLLAVKFSKATNNTQASSKNAIFLTPVIMMFLCVVFLVNPTTRRATLWMLAENHPVEILTFIVALTGGFLGLALAWRTSKHGEKTLVFGFYAAFSAALIFVGMEEVAWGQQFFGFDSPAAWHSLNLQGELTFHNIAGIHGHTEIFRLVFGLGGLVGVWFSSYPSFRKIGSPLILLPWFIVIALHAGVDVYNDYFPLGRQFDFYMQRTSEFVEMLIVISGFLYIVLNSKILSLTMKKERSV